MCELGIQDQLRQFVSDRDWSQFHTPENLAKSISIEAAELLECFQWDKEGDISAARMELADVLTYAFLLADRLGENPEELILEKMQITEEKYPIERAHGKATKYDQL
ncbi:MAG: nucleotide pyrophosphohydrolase [Corynebacterium humireducens]|jgi:NTP pyrophosphatase (non-canonical NTP hydrolase)|uniref:Nucleotide pyrophosphohydrolase n=1 Tax=Corynebacterium humireducens TaxID=1223514 RepID=A0A7X6PMI7_9CORY|nr:nucleotide pyrophosphohydrolase [Corynebacterium humireducens]